MARMLVISPTTVKLSDDNMYIYTRRVGSASSHNCEMNNNVQQMKPIKHFGPHGGPKLRWVNMKDIAEMQKM